MQPIAFSTKKVCDKKAEGHIRHIVNSESRCDAKGRGHFFLDLGVGSDDGSLRGEMST